MADERPEVTIKAQPHRDETNPSTARMPGNFTVRSVGEVTNEIRQGELQTQPTAAETDAPPPEFAPMTPEERAKRKGLLITALERGVVHDRLHVELPDYLHGEWVRKDPLEIRRMETLGFWDGNEWSARRALHSDGATGGVADVVFMITTRENKDLIDEVRHEQFLAINAKPGDVHGKQKEEKDFEAANAAETGGEIASVHQGKVHQARKHEIEDALREANRMLQRQVTNRG